MTPLKKVYEKKKKDKGSSANPKEATEPTKKKAKFQSSTQATTEPVDVQLPVHSQLETQLEPQQYNVTETILQVVEQLNEGGSEGEEDEAGEELGTEEEGGEEPYDDFRFSSRRAEKDFDKSWSKRSVIVERGIILSHFQTEEFKLKQNFEARGWTKWAQFSGTAVVPIVREFYANMMGIQHEGKDCIVTKVRGVHFKIYPKDVRKFFGLKEEKHPQFPFSEEEMLDKDSLAKILTGKPNAEWGHKNKLAKNRLSPKFNSLHFLACSQINPILNTSELSYDRGLLLYAIDKGLKVELGQIIWDNIAALIKTRKGVSGLPFGGFITKYVCKKKVTSELGEQVAKPLGPITASSRERSASHKKGKEGITSEEFMEKMLEKWDEVNVKLGEIKDDQYFIKKELYDQGKRIATIEAKLELLVPSSAAGTNSGPPEDPPLDP